MVQLKSDLPLPTKGKPDNTYWAVGEPAKVVNFQKDQFVDYKPNPISAEVMIDRKNRAERGLLAYDRCKVTELKGFIKARQIQMSGVSSARKADLIDALQKADDESKFDRLFSLPPEIRNMIFKEYMHGIPAPLPHIPHQPPLTLASSAVRNESHATFYRESPFVFSFVTTAGNRGATQTTVLPNTADMVKHTTNESLSQIRHISLGLFKPALNGQHILIAYWEADLKGKDGPGLVTSEDLERWTKHRFWSARRPLVITAMIVAVTEIWNRPVAHRLLRTDIDAIRQALHTALM